MNSRNLILFKVYIPSFLKDNAYAYLYLIGVKNKLNIFLHFEDFTEDMINTQLTE